MWSLNNTQLADCQERYVWLLRHSNGQFGIIDTSLKEIIPSI